MIPMVSFLGVFQVVPFLVILGHFGHFWPFLAIFGVFGGLGSLSGFFPLNYTILKGDFWGFRSEIFFKK